MKARRPRRPRLPLPPPRRRRRLLSPITVASHHSPRRSRQCREVLGLLGKVDELKQRLFWLRLFGIEVEVTSLHAELTGQREELETATARQSAVEEAVKANEKEKSSIARAGEAERSVAPLAPSSFSRPFSLSPRLLSSGFLPRFPTFTVSATAPFVAGRPAAEADRWQRADLDSIARGNHPHREEKGRRSERLRKPKRSASARRKRRPNQTPSSQTLRRRSTACSQSTPVRKRTLRWGKRSGASTNVSRRSQGRIPPLSKSGFKRRGGS